MHNTCMKALATNVFSQKDPILMIAVCSIAHQKTLTVNYTPCSMDWWKSCVKLWSLLYKSVHNSQ